MKKFSTIGLFMLVLSCGGKWNYIHRIELNEVSNRIVLYTKPVLQIDYSCPLNEALATVSLLENAIIQFQSYGKPSVDRIDLRLDAEDNDIYLLLFRVGDAYFSGWENKALAYGVIQGVWEKLLLDSFENNDFISLLLKPHRYWLIRIEDFPALFREYELNINDMKELYPYVNNYLLREVLWVSMQELIERDKRYFMPEEIERILSQAVVYPEITAFVNYLSRRYGKKRVVKFGNMIYSKQEWEKLFHKPINEVEQEFVDLYENIELTGIYTNQEFIARLDRLLKLYNTTTKDTLFTK